MAIKLEISGDTPRDFYFDAVKTLALMLRPPTAAAEPANPTGDPAKDSPAEFLRKQQEFEAAKQPAEPETAGVEPLENPKVSDLPAEPPKKRGRPVSKKSEEPKQVDLEEAIAAKSKVELPDDDVSAIGRPAADPAKTYTIEDCRKAVMQVYENFEKRARSAGATDETRLMADKIAYTKPLVYGFGVQKVADLKPEQYSAFMATAQSYIDGTVEQQKEAA